MKRDIENQNVKNSKNKAIINRHNGDDVNKDDYDHYDDDDDLYTYLIIRIIKHFELTSKII